MIRLRPAHQRGHADHGWLNTYYTFSFADYYDPDWMGFRSLRVINEDRVQPGRGFPTHGHRDMEILTYILEGSLEHKDSMGTGSIIYLGEVQRMTAGRGVTHSEYNPSPTDAVHLLQIWILPENPGLEPSYEQRKFSEQDRRGKLLLVASRAEGTGETKNGAVRIHQDAKLFASLLEDGETVRYDLPPHRHAWLQVARGAVTLNRQQLRAGDGAAVSQESALQISATSNGSEILLFDLA